MSDLTPKQQKFADEYIVDFNATQAAIRAGYSPKTAGSQAFDLLKKPEMQDAIAAASKKASEKAALTVESVLSGVQAVLEDATQKVYDKDGNQVMLDRANALKSLEMQGKYLQMFIDKMKIDQTVLFSRVERVILK